MNGRAVPVWCLALAFGGCGSPASTPDGIPGADVPAVEAGTGTLPELDPAWTEPSPPTSQALSALVVSIQSEARTAIGSDGAQTLDTDAKAIAPGAEGYLALAMAYTADQRFDSARYLWTRAYDSEMSAASLTALSALLGQAGSPEDAAVLARGALALLPSPLPDEVGWQRLQAYAWNNLGFARIGTGEAAGALHAYRQAEALFPLDPTYPLGLAVSYHALGLDSLAYLQATRAAELWKSMDPGLLAATSGLPAALAEDEDVSVPDAWVAFLKDLLKKGTTPGVPVPAATGPAFPAAGATVAGLVVESVQADGRLVLSRPPFVNHGLAHVDPRFVACDKADDGQWVFSVKCPLFQASPDAPGLPIVSPSTHLPDTHCGNLLQRFLAPDVEPIVVAPGKDAADTALSVATEVTKAFGTHQATMGQLDRAPYIAELCTIWDPLLPELEAARAVLKQGCPCECPTPECATCWKAYATACETILRLQRTAGDRDMSQARTDDHGWALNWRYHETAVPILDAMALGRKSCDATCASLAFGVTAMQEMLGIAPGMIGGRAAEDFVRDRNQPTLNFARCMEPVPPGCGGFGPDLVDPAKVPCVCWGFGPARLCLLADGTVEFTMTALVKVGVRTNVNKKGPSVQLGYGFGVSQAWGPVSFDASVTVWGNTQTGRTRNFYSTGAKLAVEGAKFGIGRCDSWKSTGSLAPFDVKQSSVQVSHGTPAGE